MARKKKESEFDGGVRVTMRTAKKGERNAETRKKKARETEREKECPINDPQAICVCIIGVGLVCWSNGS